MPVGDMCSPDDGLGGLEERHSDTLRALADRCEREEPSRELDAAIHCAISGRITHKDLPRGYTMVAGGDHRLANAPYLFKGRGPSPRYTTSLDTAVTPEGDDVFWRSGHDGEGPDPSLFKAEVLVCRLPHPAKGFVGRARTEAMARRAAELRARASEGRPTSSRGGEAGATTTPIKEG